MFEKILDAQRRALVGHTMDAVLRKDSATALVSHQLGKDEVGYFAVTMPDDRGLMVQYATAISRVAKVESFSGADITPGTGIILPMRNRYLSATVFQFFDVIVDPVVVSDGVQLTEATYGPGSVAGSETSHSWFFIPAAMCILFKLTSKVAKNNIVTRINSIRTLKDPAIYAP